MPRKKPHLHRYKRVKLGNKGYTVYRCVSPGCSHYVSTELVFNRICECNRCGKPMTMTKYAMTLAKPHCEDCVVRKDQKILDRLGELLEAEG